MQRRLVIAMVVTLACLPLLVLDLMGGQGGGSSDAAVVSTDVPESSLVVSVSPSEPTTTVAPPTTEATVAPATPSSTPAKKSTTTTAPKSSSSSKAAATPKASTPTTTAPAVTYVAPAPPVAGTSDAAFLACVRQRESHNIYTAVDPSGTFMGAYQIYQGGWDAVALNIGRTDLVGVRPHHAAPSDQDAIALAMLHQYGKAPWGGSCG